MTIRFALSVSPLALAATLISAPAAAQTADPAADSNVIVVTAQKREQRLQDVPLAITALSGQELQNRGIDNITDLNGSVPNLTVGSSGSDARPAIRGVRTEEVDLFNDPTIGFFVDGIYKPRTSQALAAFVDLDRVEVLRGPQGTLFGRNTYGGSVNAVTRRPGPDLGFEGSVTYGNFNDLRFEAVVNVPVDADTGFRFVGVHQRSDGYVNVLPSRVAGGRTAQDFNDNDQVYFRGTFRHASGPGEIILTVSHWHQGGFGAGGFGYTTVGSLRNAANVLDLGGTLNRNNSRNGATVGPSDTGPYDVYRDTDATRRTRETTATLQASLDLGPATLRSITGFANFRSQRNNDEDYSDTAFNILTLDTRSESLSQEFQLVSNGSGPFQYVAGLYYFRESGSENFIFPTVTTGAIFSFLQEVQTDSYAAFAQADYAFSDQFKLTLGGRYTKDDKRFRYRSPSTQATPTRDDFRSDRRFTWRVAAEYNPTPDHLIYASVSTGFRSGGSNGVNNATAPNPTYGVQEVMAYEIGAKNTFDDGRLIANVSLFYNDLDNILANTFVQVGPTQVVARSNAGSARAYGAELELAYDFRNGLRIDANLAYLNAKFRRFQVSLPSGYTLATGYRFIAGSTTQLDLSGNEIPLSPTFTASLGISYEVDLGYGTLTPAARFFYSDSYFTNEFNYDRGIPGRDVGRQGSYTRTDLTLTYRAPDNRFSISAFVRNLENEAVLNRTVIGGGGAIFQNYAPPRTFGVRAGVSF